ncbi:unnamed protein product [Urochloa decumbens]|uniref:Uncharacterized protein n=1 Tax=Urochloa decumbens TaxID=240449 RepID=A0ABC9H425_9POAL
MAAAAGTAILRSVGRSMAREPPTRARLLARGPHGRHPGPGPRSSCRPLSSSSNPTGSTPSPTDIKDLIETIELDRAKARLKRVSIYSACILLFGGSIFYGWVKPKAEEINRQNSKIEEEIIQALKQKYKRVQVIEGKDALSNFCKAQSMEASGHGKEPVH